MFKSRFLIIKTGSAIETARARFGDFEHWFQRGLGTDRFDYEISAVFEGDRLPTMTAMRELCGVLVTGSPAMVSHRHDWSERTAEWLVGAHAESLPLLGVCYGHQLIAHGLGGQVGTNPHGRRMGTRELFVDHASDPLLGHARGATAVHTTHLEAVLERPEGARVIGRGQGDPHHALYFGNRSWGVQFHPEFDVEIMTTYVEARSQLLDGEGFDSTRIRDEIRPAPVGLHLLRAFARLCTETERTGHGVSA